MESSGNNLYKFNQIVDRVSYTYYTKNSNPSIYSSKVDISNVIKINSPIQPSKPKSLLVIGSFKDFNLEDKTNNSASLHVGISNSKNHIHHFWNSYKVDKIPKRWQKCLVIPLKSTLSNDKWDRIINITTKRLKITHSQYGILSLSSKMEDLHHKNDCFSYAVRLLNVLKYNNKNNHNLMSVARRLIEPKMMELGYFKRIWNAFGEDDFIRIKN